MTWNFQNTYCKLSPILFRQVMAKTFPHPQICLFNEGLAHQLNLDSHLLQSQQGILWLSAQQLPPGAQPIALAYGGHQFGVFNILGDGRALLLGEHIDHRGNRWDIHLKGTGPTPFSRGGDGLAALGPMLREFLVSEALHYLKLPTTRSLAVLTTGEEVYRHNERLPGAILVRTAQSHIRIGTLQLAALISHDVLKELTNYTITRHYPWCLQENNPIYCFLSQVIDRLAHLVAQWMSIGFIHGVLNTDNMSISEETIDFGPCAFLDEYIPSLVLCSRDREGRYRYENQPNVTEWNLLCLIQALSPLIAAQNTNNVTDLTQEMLMHYRKRYQHYFNEIFCKKIGLKPNYPESVEMIHLLLKWMEGAKADFTNTFFWLTYHKESKNFWEKENSYLKALKVNFDEDFFHWYHKWRSLLEKQGTTLLDSQSQMREINPVIIPRNHLIEKAIHMAQKNHSIEEVKALWVALQNPYSVPNEGARFLKMVTPHPYQLPPQEHERVCQTFFGT